MVLYIQYRESVETVMGVVVTSSPPHSPTLWVKIQSGLAYKLDKRKSKAEMALPHY